MAAILLDDTNSWRCPAHENRKCRIYPKTEEALEKHLRDSAIEPCMHGGLLPKHRRKTGKGPPRKRLAIKPWER